MVETNRVVVAMSGGVDSSVAAALLVESGYEVIGMMLRLWSEPGREETNRCCTPDAMAGARRVAALLSIPFYAVDAREPFREMVVARFTDGYAQGTTPNPCMTCNRFIRWGLLLEQARSLDAGFMATGHYARVRCAPDGRYQLLQARDSLKDQSYILHVLDQPQLAQTLFPLGELTKPEVRQKARQLGLPVAERADSQDLCFLGGDDYRGFLTRQAPEVLHPGPILDRTGLSLGQHQGLAFYTIGQRKGLGIASPEPLYVLDKDPQTNTLVVGSQAELGSDHLTAGQVNWVSGDPPQDGTRVTVKIRYKARPAWASLTSLGDRQVQVRFDQPVRDVTPGQAAVFYDGEVCLGGGVIQR